MSYIQKLTIPIHLSINLNIVCLNYKSAIMIRSLVR